MMNIYIDTRSKNIKYMGGSGKKKKWREREGERKWGQK